jgi:hypothetical protein
MFSCVPGRRAFASASILLVSLLVAPGCAMFGSSKPEPGYVTVAVVTRGQSDVDLEADSTGKSALVGGGAGAVSAGLVGAGAGAALGMATGVFAPAAVPLFAAVFGAGGAAAGATTGVIVGGLQGLPSEKAEEVTRILAGLTESRDFQGELRLAVDSSLPEGRRGTSDRADATAILQLTEVELEQHLSDGVSVHMEATLSLEWGPDREAPLSKSWDYLYDTPERHVDEWLLEDGQAFGTAMTEGIETLAGQMSSDITSPPAL